MDFQNLNTVAVLIIIASDLYAMTSPAFNAIVHLITPSQLVKNAYSLMSLGINLGLAIGSTIGGILFNSHLNLLFFMDASTTLLATALVLFYVKDKISESIQQTESEESEYYDADSIFSFLHRNQILLVFSIILLLYNFCYIQWTFILPLQTVDIFKGRGASFYSILVSTNAITVILVTPFLTSVTQKTSPLKSIFIGGIFYSISFLLFSVDRLMPIFIISIIIMTIGEILISINSNNYIAQHTPGKYLGRANSMLTIFSGIGYAIGPVVMGNLIMFMSFRNAWFIVSVLMISGIFSMYLISRSEKIDNVENPCNDSCTSNEKQLG